MKLIQMSTKMLQYHLSTTKLLLILSVALTNFNVRANEISRDNNLTTATLNDIKLPNAKNKNINTNTNAPQSTENRSQNQNQNQNPNRNCTTELNVQVQFNQTENHQTNEDFVEIRQHQVNESDEFDELATANEKPNVIDTSSCFDDSPSSCNLTREEFMQRVYDYLRPGAIKWILILSHTVVFVIGLMGNALVCLAVYVNYSMRTVTNIFIVNLAVADFLVILVCLPPSVVWDITETWFLGETMCKIVLYFQTVSVTVSVLTLTLISIDRWYAICFPLRYRTNISRAIACVSIIWIIAILLDIPEFLTLTVKSGNLPYESILFSQCIPTWSESTEKKFYMTKLFLLFVFPLLLMIAAYFKIATVLWNSDALLVGLHTSTQRGKYSNSRFSTGTSNRGTISQLQARRKAAKMMVVVVIMFAICYLPVHIFNILRHTDSLEAGEITNIFALSSHWLCYANSAINPLIYNFMSGKFRREFRNAFIKCRCSNVRVEDNFLYKNGPSSRQQNNSVSMRSYHNLSVREITRMPYANSITQKNDDSHL